MCVATLQWPKTRVPLVWSYNSSLGAVLQKAALKKLYKEASQDVFLIGRYAFARSWKALNKEETSLCLNFIFQFVWVELNPRGETYKLFSLAQFHIFLLQFYCHIFGGKINEYGYLAFP